MSADAAILPFLTAACWAARAVTAVMVPLPGLDQIPIRIRLAVAASLGVWLWIAEDRLGQSSGTLPPMTQLLQSLFSALAVTCALAAARDGVAWALDVLSLQSGLSYASVIDPTSRTERPSLGVMASLAWASLGVATGLDRVVLGLLLGPRNVSGSDWFSPAGLGLLRECLHVMGRVAVELMAPAALVILAVELLLALIARACEQLQTASMFAGFKQGLALWAIASALNPSVVPWVRVTQLVDRFLNGL
jgi:flagellar biosynthesis protein FliR